MNHRNWEKMAGKRDGDKSLRGQTPVCNVTTMPQGFKRNKMTNQVENYVSYCYNCNYRVSANGRDRESKITLIVEVIKMSKLRRSRDEKTILS